MEDTASKTYLTGLNRWILVITVLTCALLEMIDATIVNVALPEISGGIGATRVDVAWLVTAYGIGNAIVIPLSGMLSDLFGRRNYFTFSVVFFTVCSLFCGLSTSLGMLVFWRFVQGLAGGGLLSTAQSIMIGAFPPKQINTAYAIFGVGVIIGPILGPVLGGLIVENMSWHWVFFVNLPVGAIAAVLSWLYITDLKNVKKPSKIDWWGIAFLVVTVSSLQYVLEEGATKDWFSNTGITVLAITAVLGLGAFIWRELHTTHPAVNISLFKNRNLALGNMLIGLFAAMMMTSMYIFPLFVETSLGWDAIKTGTYLMVIGLSCGICMQFVKKLMNKGLKPKFGLLIGIGLYALFLFMFSFSSPQSHGANFILPLILGGAGMSFLFMPMMSLSLSGLKGTDLAQGTGLFNMTKRLGGSIGLALINIFINHRNAEIGQEVVKYSNDYNLFFTNRLEKFNHLFSSAGYATDEAVKAAYKTIGQQFQQQQILMGYDQGYLFMSIALLVVGVPIILLIKSEKKAQSSTTD